MTRSLEHSPRAWVRLRVDTNCALRRGAWYRVVTFTREQVVLKVKDERVTQRRRLFQTSFAQPARWTVVPLPRDAIRVPADWGTRYLVCPGCQARAPVNGFPIALPCPSCHGVFAIGWDEHYLRRR